ncbi:MAG: putative Small Arf-related GTPase [Promethearchaeota archaeon]|nr:MAG: putative Small Arf-related GTPase [Candidatus Lokiarchaeota archaeon]
MQKDIKIIISGLDYAGKTSSLIALREKYNFEEKVKNIKPTIKIEYNSFNFLNEYEINLWDMGGQEKYRNIYIDKPEYFTDTNYFYYYIDIQDGQRTQDSLTYLNQLLEILKNIKYSNEVIICFHKYDPKVRKNKEVLDRVRNLKKQIQENNYFKFKFYRTSIFDISSLSKAISYSLNTLIDLSMLRLTMEGLIRKFNGNYIILYTNAGIILIDLYKEVLDSIQYNEKVRQNINKDLVLIQKLQDSNVNFTDRVDYNEDETEFLKKYEIGSKVLFLKVNTPPLNDEEIDLMKSNLTTFQKDIEKIFEN